MILKNILPFFLCLTISIQSLLPSIISGTLIKTTDCYITAEKIACGNTIISYDCGLLSTATITHIRKTTTDIVVAITTEKGLFYASPDQLFYDPLRSQWIPAQLITTHTTFLNAHLNHCPCIGIETISTEPIDVYHISTTGPHNFFVTEQELLTHNAFPVIVGFAWLFGEGLQFLGITLGTTVLGSYIGIQLYNAQKQKEKECNLEFHVVSCGSPCPDPDDDKSLFESIKLKSDKKMRHKRFGNFYRDPDTKLWWSKDNANHGGSIFKVFKETAKGLEWTFDADAIGHQIIGKHKGPVGLFISYKELIRCP